MTSNRNEWVVIGISGVTCGGKTSLANRLKDSIAPAYVFHQDKYFYPDDSEKHVKCDGIEHNNYDILSSLDMEAMYGDILSTMRGEDKAQARELNEDDKFTIKGKKFIIVEGFTVLNYKPILELCDFRYYIVLEYGECASRRVHRVYDPPDVPQYFELCVWPEHCVYRAQIEKDNRVLLLDGTRPDIYDTVMADLRALQP